MTDPTHSINRRVALQLMATAGAVASSSSFAGTKIDKPAKLTSQSFDIKATGTRFNLQEAERVMQELKIDALVLGNGRNFQQATGCLPVVTKMGRPASDLAILVAKPEPRVIIVMAGFAYHYLAADLHSFSDNDVFLYGFGNANEMNKEEALNSFRFANREEQPVREIEKKRVSASKKILDKNAFQSSMGQALTTALKSADVVSGRIGFDSPGVAAYLTQFAPDASLTSADDALRRIRTVKSAIEIDLMRLTSDINIKSAYAALQQIGAGASHKDLRRAYYSELVKRGSNGVFMVIDHVSDEQYDADLIAGQTFLIDCVNDNLGYLGDYGRTVFIGEPTKSAARAQIAASKAWDKLRSQLKPGLKFSEITALGQKAMQEQGTTYRVAFQPHSVGVYHSDHLGDGSSDQREDIVLRPGMVISVDCPVLETGFGGSVHLEDLMLITEDGAEPLHDLGTSAITI